MVQFSVVKCVMSSVSNVVQCKCGALFGALCGSLQCGAVCDAVCGVA